MLYRTGDEGRRERNKRYRMAGNTTLRDMPKAHLRIVTAYVMIIPALDQIGRDARRIAPVVPVTMTGHTIGENIEHDRAERNVPGV
jgi:hypothetical protein